MGTPVGSNLRCLRCKTGSLENVLRKLRIRWIIEEWEFRQLLVLGKEAGFLLGVV